MVAAEVAHDLVEVVSTQGGIERVDDRQIEFGDHGHGGVRRYRTLRSRNTATLRVLDRKFSPQPTVTTYMRISTRLIAPLALTLVLALAGTAAAAPARTGQLNAGS